MIPGRLPRTSVAAVLLSIAVSACGGGGSSSTPAKSAASTPATTSAPASPMSSVTSGPVRAVFAGPNHAPKVGAPWRFSVRVTDASGKPLSGIMGIGFTFGGQVVGRDIPPVHRFKNGSWKETLRFPARALGQPLAVQVVVHTSRGSVTLAWPVTVAQ